MLRWKKMGNVFDPTTMGVRPWMAEQAQNPFALEMDDCIRVYFNTRSSRDSSGNSISLPGFVDLDKNNLSKILNISDAPLLTPGKKGDFDEFGVMGGSVIKTNGEYLLFYVGWTRMVSVPYNWAIGVAKSRDGAVFSRVVKGPIIGATSKEPYLQAGCSSVLYINDTYHLWYTSGIKWIDTGCKAESVYQIMHATSLDGLEWHRESNCIIAERISDEAQASPSVFYYNNIWHMVYSYRHSVNFRNRERGYRLGYACSHDLISWHRNDEYGGLDMSPSGWDSEMICYPNVCQINGQMFMFYCGNNFGKQGFGVAVLEK